MSINPDKLRKLAIPNHEQEEEQNHRNQEMEEASIKYFLRKLEDYAEVAAKSKRRSLVLLEATWKGSDRDGRGVYMDIPLAHLRFKTWDEAKEGSEVEIRVRSALIRTPWHIVFYDPPEMQEAKRVYALKRVFDHFSQMQFRTECNGTQVTIYW